VYGFCSKYCRLWYEASALLEEEYIMGIYSVFAINHFVYKDHKDIAFLSVDDIRGRTIRELREITLKSKIIFKPHDIKYATKFQMELSDLERFTQYLLKTFKLFEEMQGTKSAYLVTELYIVKHKLGFARETYIPVRKVTVDGIEDISYMEPLSHYYMRDHKSENRTRMEALDWYFKCGEKRKEMLENKEKKEDRKEYYVRIDCNTDNPGLLIDRSFYLNSGLFGESDEYDYSLQRLPMKYNSPERSAEDYLTAIKDQYDKIEKLVPELGPYTLSKVCVMDSNFKMVYGIRKGDDGVIHVSESFYVNVREPNLSTDEMLDKGYITNEEAKMDKGVQELVKNARLDTILKGGTVDPEPTEEEWSEVFDTICYNFSDYDDVSLQYDGNCNLYVYSEGEIVGRYIFPYDIDQAFASYHDMKKLNEEAPVDDNDLEDIPEDESKTPRDRVREIALKQANEINIKAKPEEVDQLILILINNGYLVFCKREHDTYKISFL
jgi:hypothetical protein